MTCIIENTFPYVLCYLSSRANAKEADHASYEKVYLSEVGVEGISSGVFVGVYLFFYVYVSKIIGVSNENFRRPTCCI